MFGGGVYVVENTLREVSAERSVIDGPVRRRAQRSLLKKETEFSAMH